MEFDPTSLYVRASMGDWLGLFLGAFVVPGVLLYGAFRMLAGLASWKDALLDMAQYQIDGQRQRTLNAAAGALGLELQLRKDGGRGLGGRLHDVRVDVSEERVGLSGAERTWIRFRLVPPAARVTGVQLTVVGGQAAQLRRSTKLGAESGSEVGDSTFDREFELRGDPAEALALFGLQVRRRALASLRGLEGGIDRGAVDVWRANHDFGDPAALRQDLERLAELARDLELGGASVEQRLRENVQSDPYEQVQRLSLEALIQRVGTEHPEARVALQLAEASPDPTLQVLAALHVRGPAGLSHPLPLDDESFDAEGAMLVCRLLEKLDGTEAEAGLIRLLGHEARQVRLQAVAALGRRGTIVAVEPLLEVGHKPYVDETLQIAARTAVYAIQSRLGNAEGGRLSLSAGEDASGALSLGDAATGGLSLPPPAS